MHFSGLLAQRRTYRCTTPRGTRNGRHGATLRDAAVVVCLLPQVLWQIALCYDLQQDFKQAVKWLEMLSSLTPNDPGVLARLGAIFARMDDETRALHYYQVCARAASAQRARLESQWGCAAAARGGARLGGGRRAQQLAALEAEEPQRSRAAVGRRCACRSRTACTRSTWT